MATSHRKVTKVKMLLQISKKQLQLIQFLKKSLEVVEGEHQLTF